MFQTAKGMRINVEFPIVVVAKGRTQMQPKVSRATTVTELKASIGDDLELPPDGFGLIFDGKLLDDRELGDVGIERNAKVLVTREAEDYEIDEDADTIDPWEEELFRMVSVTELLDLRKGRGDKNDAELIVLYIRNKRDMEAIGTG
jgi:hypothetical protein